MIFLNIQSQFIEKGYFVWIMVFLNVSHIFAVEGSWLLVKS